MPLTKPDLFNYGFRLGKKAAMNAIIVLRDKKECQCETECEKCIKSAGERLYAMYWIVDDNVQVLKNMVCKVSAWKRFGLAKAFRKGVNVGIMIGTKKRVVRVQKSP